MSLDRLPESVTVLSGDSVVITSDGRRIKTNSLIRDKSMVSFSSIFREVCYGEEDAPPHFGSRRLLREALSLVDEFNQTQKGPMRLTPVLVNRGGGAYSYLLPKDQEGQMVELVKQSAERLESFLPFRVTKEEMAQLRLDNPQVRETVRMRMVYLGLLAGRNIPQDEALKMVKKVIDHPNTWELLLKSDPPVAKKSDFQKFFRTSVYRRTLNYHRDWERLKQRQQLEGQPLRFLAGSPLKEFFTEHPPESPESQRLLAVLTDKQRETFIDRYLRGGSYVGGDHPASSYYLPAKNRLEKLINMPQEVRPNLAITETARQLIRDHPEFYLEFIGSLSERRRQYGLLRFEKGLKNPEIASRLNTNAEVVRQIGFRFCQQLVSRAIDKGLVVKYPKRI